jgi:hypothetical protein
MNYPRITGTDTPWQSDSVHWLYNVKLAKRKKKKKHGQQGRFVTRWKEIVANEWENLMLTSPRRKPRCICLWTPTADPGDQFEVATRVSGFFLRTQNWPVAFRIVAWHGFTKQRVVKYSEMSLANINPKLHARYSHHVCTFKSSNTVSQTYFALHKTLHEVQNF